MNLFLRIGKKTEVSVWFGPDATVADLKNYFYDNYKYYPERQRWAVGSAKGKSLQEGLLKDLASENDVLVFKDLGVQISWRLVFVVEYLGPMIIFPMLFMWPYLFGQSVKRNLTQKVAIALVLVHYAKREFESLFIHRFSHATMPISRLPINCAHYWGLFATLVGISLFHQNYVAPWERRPLVVYLLAAGMMVAESLNFQTHIVLRNLRHRGTKERGLPQGWGFGFATSANYTFEVAAWLLFAVMVNCLTMWFFLFVATTQMTLWAFKKWHMLVKEYPEVKGRAAIIPFLL